MSPTPTPKAGATRIFVRHELIDVPDNGLASVPTVCAIAWGLITPKVDNKGALWQAAGEPDLVGEARAELKRWGLRINYSTGYRGHRLPSIGSHWRLQSAKRYKKNVTSRMHESRHVWGTKAALHIGSFVSCCRAAVKLIHPEGNDDG